MSKTIISLDHVTYNIPYSHSILEDINFKLEPGQFLGLLGHNGTGKTTLLDIILGNKQISSGKVRVLNEDPHSAARKNKSHIAYLSQDVAIKGDLSIKDFFKFHSVFYPLYSKDDEKLLIEAFGLTYDLKVGALSTGQQKKVQIIANLSTRPELILIDEITAVLDPEARDVFFRELLKVKDKYSTSVLLATNIAEDLIGRTDRVLFIADKKAVMHEPQEIPSLFNLGLAA